MGVVMGFKKNKRRYRDDGQYSGESKTTKAEVRSTSKTTRQDYKLDKTAAKANLQKYKAMKWKWLAILVMTGLAVFAIGSATGFQFTSLFKFFM
jgi:hypothetical protein